MDFLVSFVVSGLDFGFFLGLGIWDTYWIGLVGWVGRALDNGIGEV